MSNKAKDAAWGTPKLAKHSDRVTLSKLETVLLENPPRISDLHFISFIEQLGGEVDDFSKLVASYIPPNNKGDQNKMQNQLRKSMATKRRQLDGYMHRLREYYDKLEKTMKDRGQEEKTRVKRVANTFLALMHKFKELYRESIEKEEGISGFRQDQDDEDREDQSRDEIDRAAILRKGSQRTSAAVVRTGNIYDAKQPLLSQEDKSDIGQFTQLQDSGKKLVTWQQATIDVEHKVNSERLDLAKKIKEDFDELDGMFREFASHVSHQDVQLDVVKDYVEKSSDNVELGVENIKQARVYQKQGRWVLLVLLAVIFLVAIGAIVLVFSGALTRI